MKKSKIKSLGYKSSRPYFLKYKLKKTFKYIGFNKPIYLNGTTILLELFVKIVVMKKK